MLTVEDEFDANVELSIVVFDVELFVVEFDARVELSDVVFDVVFPTAEVMFETFPEELKIIFAFRNLPSFFPQSNLRVKLT